MFSLQIREGRNPYKVLPRCMTYALHDHSRKLEHLQVEQIIVPLGFDETFEWWNSLVLVLKPNGTVHMCLNPARLSQALIRLVYRDLTVSDIFPRLAITCYLTLNETSSGYHNLKLGKKSSC